MWTKIHQISFVQRGRGCSWSPMFQIFDTPTRSRDIRDQSRKLSEIAPKFGRFLALPNFRGRAGGPSKNCTQIITPASWHVVWRSFVKIFPPAQKLLRRLRWILGPIFNFHDKNFLGGPLSQLGCALGSLGQSIAFIKKFEGTAPPNGGNLVSRKMSTWVA